MKVSYLLAAVCVLILECGCAAVAVRSTKPAVSPAGRGGTAAQSSPSQPPGSGGTVSQSSPSQPQQQQQQQQTVVVGGSPGEQTQVGTIILTTTPENCEVFVDGMFVGNSPANLKLKDGIHVIEVKRDGYDSYHKEVRVYADSELSLRVALTITK